MTTFPDPIFTNPDARQAEQDLQQEYTNLTGKQLFPAQPETLLTNWAAYLKTVVDTEIQFTGEQCLVNFALGGNLDQLGSFWDASRLPAEPAIVTLEFSVDTPKGSDTFIPQGTRVRTNDKAFIFATNDIVFIPTGDLSVSILATATETGTGGNGYVPGTIIEFIDLVPDVDNVTNTTTSSSGRNSETDDEYRARLLKAPNKITVAGSLGQYEFITKSIDADISDVGIQSPTGDERFLTTQQNGLELSQNILDYLVSESIDIGTITAEDIAPLTYNYITTPRYTVDIYLLTANGPAEPDLVTKVQTYYDDTKNRPLTDVPRVFAAISKSQAIAVDVILLQGADTSTIQQRLDNALAQYVADITASMGNDIVPSQIIDRLSIEGETYSVNVVDPADIITYNYNEHPDITSAVVNIIGEAEG